MHYGLFRFLIVKLDLKTPGRETEEVKVQMSGKLDEVAEGVVIALGGKQNIKSVDACITRLRVTLKEMSQVDITKIKQLGAKEVLVIGDNLQAIFGTQSDNTKT